MSKIKYLPLAYVERYENLTDIYCSKGHFDCEPDVLLDMIADEKWGESDYSGPNIQGYKLMFETAKNNFLMMHKASPGFAVAGFSGIWKYNKTVYEPDYDFSQALVQTPKLRVYPHMIKHLPFNTFYLDFSKNQLFQYSGFFVNVKVFDSGTIRIVSLPTESNFSYIPLENYERDPTVYADAFWIKSEMINTENGMPYFDYDLIEDDMWTKDSFKTQWFIGGVSTYRLFLMQFLMYLSSKEPDIIESQDTINTYKPSITIKNKYSEIRKWNVGYRYGEKIRIFKKQEYAYRAGISDNSNYRAKRPHIRKAHWARYHVGVGRKDIITKWIEPVFVNGSTDDITATIHIVTNKEAECSSGEELVKQYLNTVGILFHKEHYVREIHRRYDFEISLSNQVAYIEFDGEQHFKSINRWKGKKGYRERRKSDIAKNEYCQKENIPLLRIRFDQAVMIPNMIDDFVENIETYHIRFNTYLSNNAYYSICE